MTGIRGLRDVETRNRIMHPKRIQEPTLTEGDVETVQKA